MERAKDRLANLGFVNEKRRRAAVDALDRQRTRAYAAEERRKQQIKLRSWAQEARDLARMRRNEDKAVEAEEKRKQNLKLRSWALQMRVDEAQRRRDEQEERRKINLRRRSFDLEARQQRQAERIAAGERREREQRFQTRAQAAMGIPSSVMAGTTSVAIVATGIEYAIARAVESVFATRRSVDRAETNLMMFGGGEFSAGSYAENKAAVNRARSGWLDKAAMRNGFGPAAALNAYTEVLKAGIPDNAAPAVTQSIMGAAAGMDLNVADTTKLVGRLSTLTQSPGNFNPAAIDGYLNAMAVVAKVTAADTQELVSAMRRGAGALGSSKLSVGDLAAFTGIGISTGMQEGKAGTFMDFTVNELVNAKNSRGQRRADLQKGFQLAGLGSLNKVSRDAANNPAELMMTLFEKMAKMSPEKAGQIASLIFMREWRGEALMMAKGSPMLRQTVMAERADTNNDHLRQAKDLSLMSLDGLVRQIGAVVGQIKDAAGKGLEPAFRAIARFLIDFGQNVDFKVITDHIEVLIEGIASGFGMGSIPEILEAIFGKPGAMNGDTLGKWMLFGRGLGKGLREFLDTIRSISLDMGFSSETLGLWATRITVWSQAIQALRPAIDLMDTFIKVLGGVFALFAGNAFLRTLATLVAGGAGAGAAGAGAGAAASGGLGALLGTISGGMLAVSIAAIAGSALAAWWGWKNPSDSGMPEEKKGTIEKKPENRQWWEMVPGMPGFDRMSYQGGEDYKGLIHKAGLTSFDERPTPWTASAAPCAPWAPSSCSPRSAAGPSRAWPLAAAEGASAAVAGAAASTRPSRSARTSSPPRG